MAPQYKLTYFNVRGRGELIRLVFAAAGVEYEDYRLKEGEWPTVKPKTPFGQVPMLEIDGVAVCQSNAISRYLARKYGLAGSSDEEALAADVVIDSLEDASKPLYSIFKEENPEKKAELLAKFGGEQFPESLEKLEKMLTSNKAGSGYFAGNKLTWADLAVMNLLEAIPAYTKAAIPWDKVPKLQAHYESVRKEPKVAAWIANRPKTEH